jgi:carbonic anhydrase/acetyltransferase-like protein (isoleucine patch superfamily)
MIKRYKNKVPAISPQACILENVTIAGDVRIGDFSSIWYGSVLRGDICGISVGNYTNIQDGSVVHVGNTSARIGNYVTVGHNVIIHGCTVGDYTLIGMGSIIMDEAEIGDHVIVGAGTLITRRKKIPPYSMVYGNPARIVRSLTDTEVKYLKEGAMEYVDLATEYKKDM